MRFLETVMFLGAQNIILIFNHVPLLRGSLWGLSEQAIGRTDLQCDGRSAPMMHFWNPLGKTGGKQVFFPNARAGVENSYGHLAQPGLDVWFCLFYPHALISHNNASLLEWIDKRDIYNKREVHGVVWRKSLLDILLDFITFWKA